MPIFGNNQDVTPSNQTRPSNSQSPPAVNIIAPEAKVEGTIRTASDLRVSGYVKGTVHVDGCCHVSPEGYIEGSVFSVNARIAGHISGELQATERVFLASSAKMDGTIRSARLIVEEGASFNGESRMGERSQIVSRRDDAPDVPAMPVEPAEQLEVLSND